MGKKTSATLLIALILTISSPHASLGAPAPAPGPSSVSACKLPSGVEIMAPEQSGTTNQAVGLYGLIAIGLLSAAGSAAYGWFSNRGRKLMQAPAVSPSTAPACCPPTGVQPGDTVSSLLSTAGLQSDARPLFYLLNPAVTNNTDTLTPGTFVTLPCYRIIEAARRTFPLAPSPSITAATG